MGPKIIHLASLGSTFPRFRRLLKYELDAQARVYLPPLASYPGLYCGEKNGAATVSAVSFVGGGLSHGFKAIDAFS
ncbi:hypothetical protein CA85_26160 [Allorhodopirellula solitaria]|uniref:Uncharacterized protein n=1 Tax=Allorhodopirellula solitaria TaxID=2527987 RepID=A0A5C5XVI1_9BACT|nr:hypothetical protein CA85_26160 [Allorhodopirellula solitaria]